MLFFRSVSLLFLPLLPQKPIPNHLPPHSFFKTLVDHQVTVELKNDISIRGVLKSVDQFLNIKLDDIEVVEEIEYPHLVRCILSPPLLTLRFVRWGR